MPEVEIGQPLEAKVDPRKWTTKVNIAVVIAVLVVAAIGAGVAIYATFNPREVREDMHREVDPSAPARP
jgi:hypothetical protein